MTALDFAADHDDRTAPGDRGARGQHGARGPHGTPGTRDLSAPARPEGGAALARIPERSRRSFEPFERVLEVVPLPDPVLDAVGYAPASPYVERFWLGLLGPSTTWLVRRFARGLDQHPRGFRVDLVETSLALGLGESVSRNSSLQRSLLRACQFGLAERVHDGRIAVRLTIPPLSRRQVERLPSSVRAAHAEWNRAQRDRTRRARVGAAARGMLAAGVPPREVVSQLLEWGVNAADAQSAVRTEVVPGA